LVPVRTSGSAAPPGRRSRHRQHPVMVEELEEIASRICQRHLGIARPDRGHQGLHEVAPEVRREPAGEQEVSEGDLGVGGQEGPGLSVEPRNLGEHPEERPGAEIPRGREQPAQAQCAGPLEVGRRHRQRHLRLLGLHAQLGEEPEQGGIGPLVVHDEPGVDGQFLGGQTVDQVRVGMAAEPGVGLEQGHLRSGPMQDPRCGQPGDAAPDHRDPVGSGHHASSNANSAIGALVGRSEPPAGSTVMPAACADPASPESRNFWLGERGSSPAGTMSPAAFWSHIS
jgi:hypothetical protein